MTVAELVRKYQDYLPAQGVHDLAHTALSPRPVVSESEQEYPPHITLRPGIGRTRTRHRLPPRKPSISDFEQGYAANVAPRYVSRSRKSGNTSNVSRIPVPVAAAPESHESSRLPSPEKRPSHISRDDHLSRPSSPYADRPIPPSLKLTKQRIGLSRPRDKPSSRVPTTASKASFRRPASTTGNKVSTIARHYERLGREAERSRSRYAVIRSRPARPVVFARAKVEVLDSVKDAIADDSESSDPSSEADDEDEGNDEERPAPPMLQPPPLPSSATPALEATHHKILCLKFFPARHMFRTHLRPKITKLPLRLAPPGQITLPSSPFLKAVKSKHDLPLTPPTSEIDSTERNSILKALSGFWQQPARSSIEVDDPMNDPEHIFRDSSMVVRLDEPTSIIALALK
jgi:1-phosphatidylinositol-3-phosphate 5-kinase